MPAIHIVAASATLLLILAVAVREDLSSHRIPNGLTLGALALGIALQSYGGGFHSFGWSVAGAAAGLASLLPFYLRKGMGAGDVKLMMAAGAFLGPVDALVAVLLSLVAGAVLAVLLVVWRVASSPGVLALPGNGIAGDSKLQSAFARATAERFPYAAAIASGVVATMWLRGLLQPLAGALT